MAGQRVPRRARSREACPALRHIFKQYLPYRESIRSLKQHGCRAATHEHIPLFPFHRLRPTVLIPRAVSSAC